MLPSRERQYYLQRIFIEIDGKFKLCISPADTGIVDSDLIHMVPIYTFRDIEEDGIDKYITSVTPVKSLKSLSEKDKSEFKIAMIE